MLKKIIIFQLLLLFMVSCTSFITLTGDPKEPLPDDYEITVYNIKPPEEYEEIGYFVLRGSLTVRIKNAKAIARKYGCNGIIPMEEEKKERTWREPIYETKHDTDPITGLPTLKNVISGYETKHEEWIEQLFFMIYVENKS